MRIALKVPSTTSLDINNGQNTQGDEIVARAWVKNLVKHPLVHCVEFGSERFAGPNPDVGEKFVIHFNPHLGKETGCRNILYFQNAYPEPAWLGGSLGVFERDAVGYDGYIFPSAKLADECMGRIGSKLSTAIVPFAADTSVYCPQDAQEYSNIACFVGNNIRGPEINSKYLWPATQTVPPSLNIYGNRDGWPQEYQVFCKGKITLDAERELYSVASICLNAHIVEHAKYGVINFRIYNILACKGFIVSDYLEELESTFGDIIEYTVGGTELTEKINYHLAHSDETIDRRIAGFEEVIAHHTFGHRVDDVMAYLCSI